MVRALLGRLSEGLHQSRNPADATLSCIRHGPRHSSNTCDSICERTLRKTVAIHGRTAARGAFPRVHTGLHVKESSNSDHLNTGDANKHEYFDHRRSHHTARVRFHRTFVSVGSIFQVLHLLAHQLHPVIQSAHLRLGLTDGVTKHSFRCARRRPDTRNRFARHRIPWLVKHLEIIDFNLQRRRTALHLILETQTVRPTPNTVYLVFVHPLRVVVRLQNRTIRRFTVLYRDVAAAGRLVHDETRVHPDAILPTHVLIRRIKTRVHALRRLRFDFNPERTRARRRAREECEREREKRRARNR
mmetsp:Transcript_547/g.2196  ORF Transcript_547/g.2196 Transcript_547/m.2196 type:complete len:301 (-) Transcript_547:33-935(-)